MTKSVNGDLRIFSGNANLPLAQKICEHLNIELGKLHVERFADGEVDVQILESVRAHDCYIIQPTCPPVNENLMEVRVKLRLSSLILAMRVLTANRPRVCRLPPNWPVT